MNRLIISGASGRMGRLIAQEAAAVGFEVAAGIDRIGEAYAGFRVYEVFTDLPKADVLVDFSSPGNLPGILDYAKSQAIPCVLGTTGYTASDLGLIKDAADSIPVFQASNMSFGIYVMAELARQAAEMLPGFDIEIIEKHHNQKADSPSGTALCLLDAVRHPGQRPVFGREGRNAQRADGEIGVHALRGGTIPGEHDVGFYGNNEVFRLVHSAQSRLIFALGALRAASYMLNKPAGLYGMKDLAKDSAALSPKE